MGFPQLRGHSGLVIEIGEAAVRVQGTGIQNGLSGLFNFCFLGIGGRRPGKIVLDIIDGVTVIAFQSATNGSHPCHMNIRLQNAKMVKRAFRHDSNLIAT